MATPILAHANHAGRENRSDVALTLLRIKVSRIDEIETDAARGHWHRP